MTSKSRRGSRRIRGFGLAIVASLALAGIGASSASALNAEWNPSGYPAEYLITYPANQFSAPSFGGFSIKCGGGTGTGTFTSSNVKGTQVLNFKECASGPFGGTCTSPGASAGHIITSPLTSTLVYLDAAKTKFGFKLDPGASPFAEVACGVLGTYKITGVLLGQITKPGLNTWANAFETTFSAVGSEQAFEQVEGAGTKYHLNWVSSGGATYPMSTTALATDTMQGGKQIQFLP